MAEANLQTLLAIYLQPKGAQTLHFEGKHRIRRIATYSCKKNPPLHVSTLFHSPPKHANQHLKSSRTSSKRALLSTAVLRRRPTLSL